MTTEQLTGDGWHRLHPLSPLVRSARGLAAVVVVVLATLAGRSGGFWDIVTHVGVIVVVAVIAFVGWLVTRWRVEDGALRIETGLLRRSSLRYPLAQIQAIDTVRPGLARLFGLSELRLRMGGSSGGSARLAYLTATHAEDVREQLLGLASGAHLRAEPERDPQPVVPSWVDERRLVSIATPQLVASIALSGIGTIVVALVAALIVVAVLSPQAAAAVVSSSVVAILAFAAGIWRRFNGDYGLTVTQAPGGLRLRSGLVQTSAEVIPHGRVQAVRMVEPILWRPLGWARLELDLAGRQRRKGESRAESKQLRAVLPVGRRSEALDLVERILPGAPAPDDPSPSRARWKSPLRFHNLAVARTDDLVATRTGRLARVTVWVPLAKAQSFRWSQGPVQRRLQLADVFVDTVGRRAGAAFRDRDAERARAELDELAAAARRARRAVPVVRRLWLAAAALLAALVVAGPATGATSTRHVDRASLGPWRATFTFDESPGTVPAYSDLQVGVWDGKKQLLDAPVVSGEPGASRPEPALGVGPSIFFRDLDGDGSPELVLQLYTGGPHCCYVDQVFDFSSSHPLKIELDLADFGARVVMADGKPLLESADDAFAYAFTDYADSGAPVLLLRYLGGRFADVTHMHPQLVEADASRWWRASQAAIDRERDARGILAAWAADEAVLGQAAIAKRTLLTYASNGRIGGEPGPGWPTGRAYVEKLWRFLATRGYV